jgi:Spy/CpxP family protein refolding chaperone
LAKDNFFVENAMKKINFLSFAFALLVLSFTFPAARAQDEPPANEPQNGVERPARRPNLLQELNLTPEQIQQIRRINQLRRPLVQEAQMRLREANRALDEAIYADVPNEFEIQEKMKAAQTAQAEVVKIRAQTEYAVRKVLTPEQLSKFRDLRRRLMEQLENRKNSIQEERQNRRNFKRRGWKRNF